MRLILADCVEAMNELDEASVDAVVCDPPYGIRFMGKAWDGEEIERSAREKQRDVSAATRLTGSPDSPNRKLIARTGSAFQNRAGEAGSYDFSLRGNSAFQVWTEEWAAAALRVLKPGGHLLAFGGTRTYHRLACAVEDAGFEIRDCIAWLYGSGFPKSLDVSKAIDRAAGVEREVIGIRDADRKPNGNHGIAVPNTEQVGVEITEPVTDAARRWNGWGTALKPAYEPVVVARKPLIGTVAQNVERYGTGGVNVDGCRVEAQPYSYPNVPKGNVDPTSYNFGRIEEPGESHPLGRWPANVLLDEQAAEMLDEQSGKLTSGPESDRGHRRNADSEARRNAYGGFQGQTATGVLYGDSGGASRFFYTAKASRAERNAGLEGFEARVGNLDTPPGTPGSNSPRAGAGHLGATLNHHPTVKPIALMRWLCRLVTPPGGTVLDPFMGSGTTGIAAVLEGFDFLGIEREAEYHAIAEARIAFWQEHGEKALLAMYEFERRREVAERGQLAMEVA